MKLDKLLDNYVNQEPRERKKGYFYASEVGAIIRGYLKPKDFFTRDKIDKRGIKNILSGQAFEAEFKRVLDFNKTEYTHEPRYEVKFDDIVITVKPDFELKDIVIETKFPASLGSPQDYLERYKHQMELEHRATKKPVYLGIFKHPFQLEFYPYKASDKTFNEIKVALQKFNKKLCKKENS